MKSCRPIRAKTLRQKTVRIMTSASFFTDWIRAPTMVFRPGNHTHTHTYTHKNIHTYKHTHTHTYIHTNTCTHIQSCQYNKYETYEHYIIIYNLLYNHKIKCKEHTTTKPQQLKQSRFTETPKADRGTSPTSRKLLLSLLWDCLLAVTTMAAQCVLHCYSMFSQG